MLVHVEKATCESCGDTSAIMSDARLWFGFYILACELPKEYLAALPKRSHETHAADNAFVAGMEEPRVPPQHAGGSHGHEAGSGEGGAPPDYAVHPLVRDASTQSTASSPAQLHLSMVMRHRGPLLKICILESRASVSSRGSPSKTFLRTEE